MELPSDSFYPKNQFRFCPFCGSEGFPEKVPFCHKCSRCNRLFYINGSSAVVALILNPAGELLVTRRANDPAKGTLDLPGGFVAPEESAETAVVREIKEELHLEVDSLTYFGSFPNRYLYNNLVYFTTDLVYICSVTDFSSLRADDDVEGYLFVKPQNLRPDEMGLPSIKNVIAAFTANPEPCLTQRIFNPLNA